MVKILEGIPIREQFAAELAVKLVALGLAYKPLIIDVVVGGDKPTMDYVAAKKQLSERVGFAFQEVYLLTSSSQQQIEQRIEQLNKSPYLCAMIIQLPLPPHLNTQAILDKIDPRVDVDLLTSVNDRAFESGMPPFDPPTPTAVMILLAAAGEQYSGKNLAGKRILVIGEGRLVGIPVKRMLLALGAKVTSVNDKTPREEVVRLGRKAEVIISAAGHYGAVTSDMVSANAVIIDAGTSDARDPSAVKIEDRGPLQPHRSKGDVADDVQEHVRAISLVPGGVGPVTVVSLLLNAFKVAESQAATKTATKEDFAV